VSAHAKFAEDYSYGDLAESAPTGEPPPDWGVIDVDIAYANWLESNFADE